MTPPFIALRVVTTYDDTTRRFDVQLRGSQGVVVEDGASTPFSADRLWPTLRDLLPPVDLLREDPHGRTTTGRVVPGPGFAESCTAAVVVATMVGTDDELGSVAVRTWLTSDRLWSVQPLADGTTDVHAVPAGSLADLLVWDVTAAMETLVRVLEAAS